MTRTISSLEPTRYEITASDGTNTWLIGYTPRRSKMGLLSAVRRVGPETVARLGVGDDALITFATKPYTHAMIGSWCIKFTGRTQREAHTLGVHPFIAAQA